LLRDLARLVAAIVALLASALHASAEYEWQFAGWYGGGCYPNVAFDPHTPGRLYLTSDVAGLWRSDNRGDTWQFITRGLTNLVVTEVAISPSAPNVVYAATRGGIHYSTNAGDNWLKANDLDGRITFSRPENYRSVLVGTRDAATVCVGTALGEVFCSRDFGLTWSELTAARLNSLRSPVVAVHYLPARFGLLAARDEGIEVYSFVHRAWSPATPRLRGITDVARTRAGFAVAAGGKVWLGDRTGQRWTPTTGKHPGRIYRVEQGPLASQIYAEWQDGWRGGLLVSRDAGASWESIGQVMHADIVADPTRSWAGPGSKSTSLKIDPHDPRTLVKTDWWGVWRSDDGGQTFTEKIVGAPNVVGADLAFSPDGSLWAATMDNGLLQSRDLGRTYQAIVPSTRYKDDLNGHVWRVLVVDKMTIIATSSPWNVGINQVLVSDDGGTTFRQSMTGLPATRPNQNTLWGQGYPRGLAYDTAQRPAIYLAIDGDDGGGLYISRDRGETWSRSPGQPTSLRIYNGLAVDPADPNYLYWGAVGDDGGIYRSRDGGLTWHGVLQKSRAIFDIRVAVDHAVYASGEQRGPVLFVSHDHGDTWRLLKKFAATGAAKAIATHPHDARIVAVSTIGWSDEAPQTIHISLDEGTSWTDATGNLPPGSGAAALTFTPDGRYLFASRAAGGIYRLDLEQLRRLPQRKVVKPASKADR